MIYSLPFFKNTFWIAYSLKIFPDRGREISVLLYDFNTRNSAEFGNYLGHALANIAAVVDPEVVVIGGGVSKVGEILFEKVREVVNTRCFKSMAEHCKVVPAGLGTDAGVIGAVALAILESK